MKPEAISTESGLISVLSEKLKAHQVWRLGIDGVDKCGKSLLATNLASALNCSIVRCDDYLINGKLYYPHALDLEKLRVRLAQAEQNSESLILEGVMLLRVTRAISYQLTTSIYVRHNWPTGVYTHQNHFVQEELKIAMESENDLCRAIGIADTDPILARELLSYHKEFIPQLAAEFVYDNSFCYDY